MSNLACPVCAQPTLKCEVRAMYKGDQFASMRDLNGREIGRFDSYLKAERFILDQNDKYLPCALEFVYSCQRCKYEDIKLTRILTTDLLPQYK